MGDAQRFPIGAQLFAIQNELEKDLHGTLQKIAAIGYSEVEAANVLSKASASMLKQALDSVGLNCRSAQFVTPMLLANPAAAIEIALALGIDYIISPTPWVADPTRRKNSGNHQQDFLDLMQSLTLDDWKWNAEQFNKVGEKIKAAGLQFGYHNHGFDFKVSDGKTAIEELLRLTDPDLVALEMDCGWVANAGYDPAEFLQCYAGRVQLLHIKDIRKKSPTTEFDIQSVAVGSGCIDWSRVFRVAKAADVKGGYVELEPPFVDPAFELFKRSYDFIGELKLLGKEVQNGS